MPSRAQVYRSKMKLSLAGGMTPQQMAMRHRDVKEYIKRISGVAQVAGTTMKGLPSTIAGDGVKAVGLLKQTVSLFTNVANDLQEAPDMDMSFADLEGVDTVAMGKKAKADLKAVAGVVKQLAKLKPNSKWAEAEAFIQRALQNM